MSRARRLCVAARNVLLSSGAVLGVLCLVAVVACVVLGARPMVVTSGSMSPTIPAGSLVLTQGTDAADVEIGDVVAVEIGSGSRVMHRVIAVESTGHSDVLTLQGDANATPDRDPYVVRRVGLVRFHVALLGYPVTWLATSTGMLALGAGAAGLLLFAFRRTPTTGGRRRALTRVAAPVTALIVAGTAQPAGAWFDDAGTVTSGTIATHTVVSQAQPTCTDVNGVLILGNIARLTWSQVDAKYEYYWELQTTSGTAVASGTVGTGQAAGTTVTLDISTGLVGVNANYNVVVRARLASFPTWVAGTTTTTQVRRASILVIGLSMRCGWA